MVMQLLFWLLLLWRCELLDMTEEDSRPPLAPVIWWWKNSLNEESLEVDIANSRKNSRCTIFLPVICLADIELLLAWLWALELLVPVIITACPSWAMAAEQKYLSSLFTYLVIYFSQNKTDIRSLIFVCFDLTVMTILSWLLSSRQPGGCWELRTSSAIGQRMRKHRPASQPFVYFVENRKIQKFFFREKIKCECESTRQFSGSRNKTFEYQGPALRKIVSK